MAIAPINDNYAINADSGDSEPLGKANLRLVRSDAQSQQERRIRANRAHFDSMGYSNGLHMARQLEHVYEDILTEDFPENNALDLFDIDDSVSPGARTHTVRRISQQGSARVYRGNSTEVPRVAVSQDQQEFPVRHYVTSFEIDIFEQLSSDYANSNLRQHLREGSKETLLEFWNNMSWHGSSQHGIYGIFNYPWTPRMVFPVKASPSSDAGEFLFYLDKAASFAHEESKQVYSPDYAVTSKRVHRYLSRTRLPGYDDGTKIKEDFLDGNEEIEDIGVAHECRGAGPGGTDIMFFFRRTRRSVANVLVQAPQMLPLQKVGFADKVPLYMSHGGIIERDVLNCLIVFIDASEM